MVKVIKSIYIVKAHLKSPIVKPFSSIVDRASRLYNILSFCRRAKQADRRQDQSQTGNEGGPRKPQGHLNLLSIVRCEKLPTIYGDTLGLGTTWCWQDKKTPASLYICSNFGEQATATVTATVTATDTATARATVTRRLKPRERRVASQETEYLQQLRTTPLS